MNDSNQNQDFLSSQPLSIDVDSIISACSSWEKEIKSVNIKNFPIANTLSPLTSNKIAIEIKTELEKMFETNENSLISTIAAIKNFCEEQIRISEVEEVEEEIDVVLYKTEDYKTVTSSTGTVSINDTDKVGNIFTGSSVLSSINTIEANYNEVRKEFLKAPISSDMKKEVLISDNNNLDTRLKDFFVNYKLTKPELYAILKNQINRLIESNNFTKDSLFKDEDKYNVVLSSISKEKETINALLNSDNFKQDLVSLYKQKGSDSIADMMFTISLKTNVSIDDLIENNSDYLKYKVSELQNAYNDIYAISSSELTSKEEILESLFGE